MAATTFPMPGAVPAPSQKVPEQQPVPRATDLDSALKAIQALTNNSNIQAAQILSGTLNSQAVSTPSSSSGGGNYVEDKRRRTTKTIRVFNPADNTQYVDTLQITGLTFIDPTTGNSIVWKF